MTSVVPPAFSSSDGGASGPDPEPRAPGENLAVLVVEDEWLIWEDLKDQLEGLGHQVLGPALDCAAALEILFHSKPDIALVDAELGSETCEAVLDELVAQGVPVVICSGHARDSVPAFAAPFPHLSKPFSQETVQEALAGRD